MLTHPSGYHTNRVTKFLRLFALCAVLFLLGHTSLAAPATAEAPRPTGARRSLYPHEWGIDRPAGLAYAQRFQHFFLLDKGRGNPATTTVVTLTPYEELVEWVQLDLRAGAPLNMTYDEQGRRLLLLDQQQKAIAQVTLTAQGRLEPATLRRSSLAHLRLGQVQGLAVDQAGQRLLLLEKGARRVVSLPLTPALDFPADAMRVIDLAALGNAALRGLAVHPASGQLFIGAAGQQLLYEVTPNGQVVNQYTTAALALNDPQAFVFAPSADLTDDPATWHLFVADSYQPTPAVDAGEQAANQLYLPLIASHGEPADSRSAQAAGKERLGEIVEVALNWSPADVTAAAPSLVTLSLVRSVNTSVFTPPSPDPSGLAFIPSRNRLLISDAEVNEIPALFSGVNLFESTLPGALVRTGATVAYSIEPTGVAFNPTNAHLFIADDDKREIFEISVGADALYGTGDDGVTSFDTAIFNSFDPEGVTYDVDAGVLFIADGINAEVYRVSPGANGLFDGVPARGGDDVVSNFDVQIHNIFDPEGIYYDTTSRHLFLVANNRNRIYELTTTGALVELYDMTVAQSVKNGDITLAPGSNDPAVLNFYVVDRGIDNDVDPNENDGKWYELSRPANLPTRTPTPIPTPDPNSTPPPDLIFADGFESGDLSAWSASNTDNGNVSVSAAAALQGNQGMQVLINDNVSIYIVDESPNAEPRYRARFYFDPNAIPMSSGDAHYLLIGYDTVATTPRRVLYVDFRFLAGSYQIRLRQQDDSQATRSVSWVSISDAVHTIELDWQAATAPGANNGSLTLWIDGVQSGILAALDNDTRRIDRVRLGAASEVDSGTRGTYYLDAFVSRRQTFIGP